MTESAAGSAGRHGEPVSTQVKIGVAPFRRLGGRRMGKREVRSEFKPRATRPETDPSGRSPEQAEH